MDSELIVLTGRRYYKCSLWVTVGITLVGLLLVNVFNADRYVNPLAVSAVYSIVSSVAYGEAWKAAARVSAGALSRFYLIASAFRLLCAALVVVIYCLVDRDRDSVVDFIVVFLAFYFAILITDCAFFAHFERKVNRKV